MHGGMKFYRGSPGAARTYVEQDRSGADDYYLAEGSGVADRYVASPLTGVSPAGSLTGEAYERWVAGFDVETGAAKGRLRTDAKALRFVEVVVNGPRPGRSRPRCIPRSPTLWMQPRPVRPSRSSAGSPSTPPPGSDPRADRSRSR